MGRITYLGLGKNTQNWQVISADLSFFQKASCFRQLQHISARGSPQIDHLGVRSIIHHPYLALLDVEEHALLQGREPNIHPVVCPPRRHKIGKSETSDPYNFHRNSKTIIELARTYLQAQVLRQMPGESHTTALYLGGLWPARGVSR